MIKYIHIYNTEKLNERELPEKIQIDANDMGIEGEYNFAKKLKPIEIMRVVFLKRE